MSKIPPVLKPVNRHLTIIPHLRKSETKTGVLLPDDFEVEEDRFITATVLMAWTALDPETWGMIAMCYIGGQTAVDFAKAWRHG